MWKDKSNYGSEYGSEKQLTVRKRLQMINKKCGERCVKWRKDLFCFLDNFYTWKS